MSLSARTIASSVGTSIWAPLEAELEAWHRAGRVARFWWRDDDAIAPSKPLDRLLALVGDNPLALAVIPATATAALADRLADVDTVTVLQHGIAHTNHAAPSAKKVELAAAGAIDALSAGRHRLAALFGHRFLPVLVPPWNRIAAELVALLPTAGFIGLSTAGRRASSGIRQINTHLDPIDWHGTRRCRPAGDLVGETTRLLSERRSGVDGAVGLLTHHLLDDTATEQFANDLARLIDDHPAARWVSARELWPA